MSIPSNGYLSFLPLSDSLRVGLYGMCQFPQTGITHFYILEDYLKDRAGLECQFPQTGITHFYLVLSYQRTAKKGCVNSLKRVSLISTQFCCRRGRCDRLVSIPSNGYHSFLHPGQILDATKKDGCQFPQTGITHFYGILSQAAKIKASKTHFCR